jgi:hypothetical protein
MEFLVIAVAAVAIFIFVKKRPLLRLATRKKREAISSKRDERPQRGPEKQVPESEVRSYTQDYSTKAKEKAGKGYTASRELNTDEQETIKQLEEGLVRAIQAKDPVELSRIRNDAMNKNFRLKDDKLELIQKVALSVEIYSRGLLENASSTGVPTALIELAPNEWRPTWWGEILDEYKFGKAEESLKQAKREEGIRIGKEDDFISHTELKSLPKTYWLERREVLLPICMEYVSAKGEATTREVDITTFSEGVSDEGGPDIYLEGFCHIRNARRTFLASRSTSITVLETGEIFQDVASFREYISHLYLSSQEGRLDKFFGEKGGALSEITLFIGRAEGRLKNRVKKVLLKKLSELSGVPEDELKSSKVCKTVFKEVGFDSRDFNKTVKDFGERVYEDPNAYYVLESILSEISTDGNGATDEVIASMAKKTLKKVAPPPNS